MLIVKNIRKTYRVGETENQVLNGIDLKIGAGEFVSIMGPSGSGKSTLMHIIGGIDRPSSGEIWIDGQCLSRMDDTELTLYRRKRIGFVFQFFNLISALTVTENIMLPLQIAGKNPKEYRKNLDDLLEMIGLAEKRHHKPWQLSGGEQQRVAIVRAFMTEPELILLDEPTGSLDSKNGEKILKLLSGTHSMFKTTVIMVTHNPVAASYAQRILYLKDGLVVDDLINARQNHTPNVIYDRLCGL